MMRRMKIRAKPNFGVGGGASRPSAAKPASQGSAPCQETQNPKPPNDNEKVDADISIISKSPVDNKPEPSVSDKLTDKTPEPSESLKVCPGEEKVPEVREDLNQPEGSVSLKACSGEKKVPQIKEDLNQPEPSLSLKTCSEENVSQIKENLNPPVPSVSLKACSSEEKVPQIKEDFNPPEPPEPLKVCPAEEKVPQIRENLNQLEPSEPLKVCPTEEKVSHSLAPVAEDKTDTPEIVDQKPAPVKENKRPHVSLDTSASVSGSNKRRARIRVMPTLVSKKKKEEDKVTPAKQPEQIPVEVQPSREVSPHEVSRGSASAEPSTTTVELEAESNTDNQTEQPKVKPDFSVSKKEVIFVDTEVEDRKLVDITDVKKESKSRDQTKKIKHEGLSVSCKENAESHLQSNIKPCRKKKLSENNETDPELEVVNVVNSSAEKQGKKKVQKGASEEIGNSDDSTGDKENASSAITEMSNQERTVRENKPLATQKTKTKTPPDYSSEKLFGRLERKIKIEDSTEKAAKQVFRKRKDEFRKKLSKGDLEPGKMTMFDLIYWNPASNPMPGRTSSPKRNGRSSGRSDTDSIASETVEEQQVDDLGLDPTDSEHQSRPESPEVVEVKNTQEKPAEENKDNVEKEEDKKEDTASNDEDSSAGKDVFAPRVKIGPNGEIMIDEQSIKIQTTAAKNRDEVLKKAVVVEESGDSSHYGKWSKRRRRSFEWTVKETALFYKALSTVGTDFSLMETLIKWRTRAELKTKFKKEERNNRELVDMALNDSTQFDMTVFEEESDYDPKEDRKAARQAERAEAKRRRLEMKQQDKIKEMEKKKQENKKNKAEIMNRKKMLRRAYRSRAKKRKEIFESDNEDSPSLYDSDNNVSEDSAPEQPQQVITVGVKPRPRLRGRQPKRRNSLVISEVTVTMETVKYDKPAEQNFIPEQTIEETGVSQKCSTPFLEAGGPNKGDDHQPHEGRQQIRSPKCVTPERNDEQGSTEEHREEDEMTLLNEYELPVNEGLPESNIIESILSEDDETNPNITQIDDVEDNVPSRNEEHLGEDDGCVGSNEATTVLEPYSTAVEPVCEDDNQKMWHFPISAIQTLEDGQQVIPVPTPNGHYSVPVPILPPGTSNVVVVATNMPDCPGEHIYHVYIVSPLEAMDTS